MNAQVNIEFIISAGIFAVSIIYVVSVILNSLPSYHEIMINEVLKSKPYQISEAILLSEGEPKNWNEHDINQVSSIGLSTSEPYVLDKNKLEKLNETCNNNYEKVKEILGQNLTDVIIKIEKLDGTLLVDCEKTSKTRTVFWVNRIGILNTDNEFLKIRIGVMG